MFGLKVIFTRLSHAQTLTYLAALSIAMELVAMAAEEVLTANQTMLHTLNDYVGMCVTRVVVLCY